MQAGDLRATPWYRWEGEDLILVVHVQPGASRDALAGTYGERLKITLTAPPTDGRANRQLLRYLAKLFGVANGRVELLAGQTGRAKRIRIRQPVNLPAGITGPTG